MDEKAINYYIYHDIVMTNAAVKVQKLNALNRRVMKINRGLATLTLTMIAYLAIMNARCEMQHEKIEKLSKDIEKLKKAKGE